jgi:hypothetical protein
MTKLNDFGFTHMSEDDIFDIKAIDEEAKDWQTRAHALYDSFLPLLNNLSSSEKEYIYWPNRSEDIENFKKKMSEILYD